MIAIVEKVCVLTRPPKEEVYGEGVIKSQCVPCLRQLLDTSQIVRMLLNNDYAMESKGVPSGKVI